jgi:signal transduction histidine kinase
VKSKKQLNENHIAQLVEFTNHISNGDFDYQIDINSNDEMGQIYEALNLMTLEIKSNRFDLEWLNQDLEQKVNERTDALKKKNDELYDALEKLKMTQDQLVRSEKLSPLAQLVAGFAHELNTPIGIGVTAATHFEMLSDDIVELYDSGKMKKTDLEGYFKNSNRLTKMVYKNLRRAGDLISRFKKVSVDQVSQEQRQFEVKSYIEDVIYTLYPRLKKYAIKVSVEAKEEITINSYPGELSQIITNLIMNSLNHAFEVEDEGDITINVDASETDLFLIYKDTGKGIPSDQVKKIFDPFFTTKRGHGGTGLGLYLIHNLVTQHFKGSISCVSKEGRGTVFSISFPRKLSVDGEALASSND